MHREHRRLAKLAVILQRYHRWLVYHGFVVLSVYGDASLFCDDVSDLIKVREEGPSVAGIVLFVVLLFAVSPCLP